MPPRKRQGNPEFWYYPLPTECFPIPTQGYPEPWATEVRLEMWEPPRDLGIGVRLTVASEFGVKELVAEENDVPENHLALVAQNACCLTCGEQYPGTGTEHWIAWNGESGRWEARDAAHPANWILGGGS